MSKATANINEGPEIQYSFDGSMQLLPHFQLVNANPCKAKGRNYHQESLNVWLTSAAS